MIDHIDYKIKYKSNSNIPYRDLAAAKSADAISVTIDIYTENGNVVENAVIEFYPHEANISSKFVVLDECESGTVDRFLNWSLPNIVWYGGKRYLRGRANETVDTWKPNIKRVIMSRIAAHIKDFDRNDCLNFLDDYEIIKKKKSNCS